MTRLHREHVNRFTIEPFYSSSEVILPGEIGIIEFIPDQVGESKIRNVGHNFEADLVVVETEEEAKKRIADRGIQMYSLIHSVDDFRRYLQKVCKPELPISNRLDPSNAPSSTRAIVVFLMNAVNHPIKLTKPSLGVVS